MADSDTTAGAGDEREARPRSRVWLTLGLIAALVAAALLLAFLIGESVPAARPRLARDSVEAFLDAVRALGDRLAQIGFGSLAAGLGLSTANVTLRTFAWRNIVAAAYPATRVRWRWVLGATYAGVGVNAVLPGRIGDAVKLVLVRRRVPGTTYPTLAATLVTETLFDLVVGLGLLVWAWRRGVLPGTPELPDLPLFEISWYAQRPWIVLIIAGVAVALVIWAQHRVRAFWTRVRQGLVILTTPGRYLRGVVIYQALGWGARVGAAYFFLDAFGVQATLQNALLVQVAGSLATLLPATPGGLGPRQALLVVLLAGSATRGTLLAFAVGMELALTTWNALLGFTSLALMVGSFGFRRALRRVRSERDSAPP